MLLELLQMLPPDRRVTVLDALHKIAKEPLAFCGEGHSPFRGESGAPRAGG